MIELLNLNLAVGYGGFASLDDLLEGLEFSVKATESSMFFSKSSFGFLVAGLWRSEVKMIKLREQEARTYLHSCNFITHANQLLLEVRHMLSCIIKLRSLIFNILLLLLLNKATRSGMFPVPSDDIT